MLAALWFFGAVSLYAEDESPSNSTEQTSEKSAMSWPLEYIIQPFLNGLIYPLAKPVDYAIKNGIIEKSVELISFGEDYKIMIYPSFNFKPGSRTMVGANYRHRSVFLEKDYLVMQGEYYANGDVGLTARYVKHSLFGTSLFGGFRYDIDLDRDKRFNIPETKESYLQPDSSYQFTWRLGAPITKTANWNAELWASLYFSRASHPDIQDSVLISDDYKIEDRGLYQNVTQVPVGLSLVYDNLDLPYAPSRGSRVVLNGTYTFVGKYSGVRYDDLGISIEDGQDEVIKDGGKKHDFYTTEFIFQHYFLLGSSHQYVLSAKEARENRRFYTDFSWEEAVRVWRPENMRNTLFERRVIAMQYRLVSIWELEEGGAPHDAFINLNSKAPLRGYDDKWVTHNLMSFSVEYRWPVDRLVDGVIFDEYALIAPKIDKWSLDHYYNSWGFGIRVRQPDLYLFRLQFGFHGLHGVNLIMTIAPEFK
ncbi:BamA/TamA family outer membrane protein [Fibrobacter sp. UWB8]|uniref:BamA/TamA family outer membrane protein n=1 Tax=Fibrobacter sp. UWB8 TaxID=1896207 RepID=UPI0013562C73|nr:BamA/TamA family outer membrane protein [Fibrobacter sp. UWB8]